MTRAWRFPWHILVCAGTFACQAPGAGDRTTGQAGPPPAPPPVEPSAATAAPTIVHYAGSGFTLELPPGSRVGHGPEADTLRGPVVAEPGRSGELGGPGPHPTFEVTAAAVRSASEGPLLAAWVDSVRRARNAVADEIAQIGPAEPDSLGAGAALRLEPYCGDCDAAELYAARGDRVVRLAFERGIHLAGTRDQQAAAYRELFRTFRWAP